MSITALIKYGPYVILGVACAALLALWLIARNDVTAARAEQAALEVKNKTLTETNALQAKAIDRIVSQRAIDDKVVSALNGTLATIAKDSADAADALANLKDTNPDAKAFLDTPLPASVKCLYA